MKASGTLGLGLLAAQAMSPLAEGAPDAIVRPAEYKWRMAHCPGGILRSTWEARGVDTMKMIGDLTGIEVIVFDGEASVDGQRRAVEDMAGQDWDFASIHPWAIDAFVDPINQMIDRGIPFFQLDTIISSDPDEVDYVTFLEPDNIFMGSIVTDALVKALGGQGQVVHTQGMLTHTGAQGRAKGFTAVVANYPDIEVVDETPGNWDPVATRALWEDLLVKYPDIKGGMFHNDDMALAAYQAVKAAGKENEIALAGVDGMEPAIQALMDGKIAATVINPTGRIHGDCIWIGWMLVTGKHQKEDVPKYILTDAPLVDQKNAPGFLFLAENLLI
jgi:ribose transport system substrate-binding protein